MKESIYGICKVLLLLFMRRGVLEKNGLGE